MSVTYDIVVVGKGRPMDACMRLINVLVPVLVAGLLAGLLLLHATLQFPAFELQNAAGRFALLQAVATPLVLVGIALLVGVATRLLLLPMTAVGARPAAAQEGPLRDHLARQVVTSGTIVIGVLAAVLIVMIGFGGSHDLTTTGLSIFTAVLPVFSTWVGTVLAAYFTNESYRRAAENTQNLANTSASSSEPITRAGTMVPYDRVVRYDMTADEETADPQAGAATLRLSELQQRFQPPGIVRVVIFDSRRRPVYVLRHEAMPTTADANANATLALYLNDPVKKAAARNFALTASSATIADGRRLLQTRKVTDLFVTEHGRDDEPAMGWVPDDNLRQES